MPLRSETFTGPLPKPRSRAAQKKASGRKAAKVVKSVRAQCVERDGYCRAVVALALEYGEEWCRGVSEWAHLGDKKRFKTRGQAPEVRHTTAGSLMLCTKHHRDYDEGRIVIDGDDANLPLQFRRAT